MNKQTRKFIWGLVILFAGSIALLLAVYNYEKGNTISWIIQGLAGIFQVSLAVYRIESSIKTEI